MDSVNTIGNTQSYIFSPEDIANLAMATKPLLHYGGYLYTDHPRDLACKLATTIFPKQWGLRRNDLYREISADDLKKIQKEFQPFEISNTEKRIDSVDTLAHALECFFDFFIHRQGQANCEPEKLDHALTHFLDNLIQADLVEENSLESLRAETKDTLNEIFNRYRGLQMENEHSASLKILALAPALSKSDFKLNDQATYNTLSFLLGEVNDLTLGTQYRVRVHDIKEKKSYRLIIEAAIEDGETITSEFKKESTAGRIIEGFYKEYSSRPVT